MSNTINKCINPSELKPWMKYFPEDSHAAEIPYQTIYESLKQMCAARPDAKALYYYGTTVTYNQLLEKVDTIAAAFYGMGVRPGDMVSLLMPTMPESIYSLYAVNKIGAVPNFIDPRMDTGRILSAAEGVASNLMVTIDLAFPKVAKIMSELSAKKIVAVSANTTLRPVLRFLRELTTKDKPNIPYGDKILRWKDFLKKGRGVEVLQAPFEEGSVAAITYTGGTTGSPKGVMITNDGLNSMAESFALSGVDHEPGERFLAIMPIFSSYGVGCGVHMPLKMGLELVVIPSYTPDQLGSIIRKYRTNHMMAVPTFYEQIMHSKAMWDFDLSFLKTTGCGGDTMNPGLQERFNRFLKEHNAPYKLSQGYGLSEMTGAATCCFSDIYKDDSSGIPLICNTVGIFDPDTGEELDFNQEGEICLTGRGIMLGYHNNPEETVAIMHRHADGKDWIHSGDIGYLDEDGFLYIKGRIKRIIIKFDGHKVFPVSIEGVVNSHKAVATCAVIGIQDPDHVQGEVPLIVVELRHSLPPNVDKAAIRREILDICDGMEERGKPADLVFIDEMLHTALGKYDYRKLTELYKDHVVRPR